METEAAIIELVSKFSFIPVALIIGSFVAFITLYILDVIND